MYQGGMARTSVATQLAPPEFLRLAGHPLRWRLLSELSRSDRMVHELTGLIGQPQNLVSYHLGKLRDGRLVTARRSSADGRDTFYAVDLARLRALLVGTATALHPGLGTAPPDGGGDHDADGGASGTGPPARVLFLCTGNSARSQMAEGLARVRSGGTVEAFSAGSRPKALHPDALRVMREHGVDLSGHRPKHLDEFADQHFDRVVTLCDRVREVCPEFPGDPERTHWSIPDPSAPGDGDVAGYAAFRRAADELEGRVGFLLAALGRPAPTTGARRAR